MTCTVFVEFNLPFLTVIAFYVSSAFFIFEFLISVVLFFLLLFCYNRVRGISFVFILFLVLFLKKVPMLIVKRGNYIPRLS